MTPVLACISLFAAGSDARLPTPADLRSAVERGLVRVEAAAENYPNHRDCFSCHHQTLPVVAMGAARRAEVEVDADLLDATVEFSLDSFRAQRSALDRGTGVGGRNMTVGYGLWTFWDPARPGDDLTGAMADFLLKNQESDGSWDSNKGRPPLEGSAFTATTLALLGLESYLPGDRQAEAEAATERGLEWLRSATPATHEDRVFRLWGLWAFDADEAAWSVARDAVINSQRDDGGWSQTEEMESDAYATGQALFVLRLTGLNPKDPTIRRGERFLVQTQLEDGSWKVETRARAFQTFFENGDPHGRSQFISTAGTCWAVAALAGGIGPHAGYGP